MSFLAFQEELRYDGAFKAEGEVSGIAEDRHFKEMEPVDVGYGVDPLSQAVQVPHFPEEAADECGEAEAVNAPPIAVLNFREKRGVTPQCTKGDQQNQRRNP